MVLGRTIPFVMVLVLTGGVLAVPGAAADDPPIVLPPNDFHGSYDQATQEVDLAWQAPTSDGWYAFNVYRDGSLAATTTRLHYTDTVDLGLLTGDAVVTYHVTAVAQDRDDAESAPTAPYTATTAGHQAGHQDGSCPLLGAGIDDQAPFLYIALRGQCLTGSNDAGPQSNNEPEDEEDGPCEVVSASGTDDPPFMDVNVHQQCIPGSGSGPPQLLDDVPLPLENAWRITQSL